MKYCTKEVVYAIIYADPTLNKGFWRSSMYFVITSEDIEGRRDGVFVETFAGAISLFRDHFLKRLMLEEQVEIFVVRDEQGGVTSITVDNVEDPTLPFFTIDFAESSGGREVKRVALGSMDPIHDILNDPDPAALDHALKDYVYNLGGSEVSRIMAPLKSALDALQLQSIDVEIVENLSMPAGSEVRAVVLNGDLVIYPEPRSDEAGFARPATPRWSVCDFGSHNATKPAIEMGPFDEPVEAIEAAVLSLAADRLRHAMSTGRSRVRSKKDDLDMSM